MLFVGPSITAVISPVVDLKDLTNLPFQVIEVTSEEAKAVSLVVASISPVSSRTLPWTAAERTRYGP
jgi:hypothetical protein